MTMISPKCYNPIIYEKTDNGEMYYDVFSRLLKERIIFLGGQIDSDLANSIICQLLWLEKQSEDDIQIYINSEGGDLASMFAMYDVMQYIKPNISTCVVGMAASAAAVLLSAGTPGMRYSLPNSEIMIHQPLSWGGGGQVTDIEITTTQLKKAKTNMLNILATSTNKPFEQIKQDCERDFWLSPEEAVAYGLIDEIVQPTSNKVKQKKAKAKSKTK